jgi:hypothetical protein
MSLLCHDAQLLYNLTKRCIVVSFHYPYLFKIMAKIPVKFVNLVYVLQGEYISYTSMFSMSLSQKSFFFLNNFFLIISTYL